MKFEPIPCHESLHPYVRNYWLLTAQCTAPGTQRVFSNGAMSLHFYLTFPVTLDNDGRTYTTSLNRHDLSVMDVHTVKGDFQIFGVEFVPFGARAFWDLRELNGPHLTPQDLGDAEFEELEKNIKLASSVDERRILMDNFLMTRLEQKVAGGINMQRLEDVFSDIDESDSTKEMASNACLGPKQFTRVFNEYVGIPPKSYQRLVRFHKAMLLMREHCAEGSLTSIAYDCGYSDLAHMTNEFKQLCGKNPSELIAMGDSLTEVFQSTFSNLMKKKIEVENLI